MSTAPTPPPRHIGAGHGFKWLLEALRTVRRWPGTFLVMGFIMAVISLVPYLGGFAILFLGPALLAGIVTAADTAWRGGTPATYQLFTMFQETAQRNEALKLCLPLVVGKLVAFMVLVVAVFRIMARRGMDVHTLEGHPEKALVLFTDSSMPGWLALALAIVLLAWTFTALAIPRVALRGETAFVAMGESFRRVWRSIGAWIVVAVLLFAGLVLLMTLLMLTQVMAVMQLGLYTALYAVLGPLLHAAWRDLDGHVDASDKDDRAPPPPPAPPPPSGILEA